MSIEDAIYTTLAADNAVSALVSTRIYKQFVPQSSTFPRISYFIVNQDIDHSFDGASGLYISNIQIDCRAESYDSAKTLSSAVRDALDDLTGTVSGTVIQALSVERLADIHEAPTNGNQLGIHNSSLELTAWHTES